MNNIVKTIMILISFMSISNVQSATKISDSQVLSFMITNEGIKKGRIKIKQRPDDRSPYLIIGCNHKNEDFEVMIGNLSQKEFNKSSYTATIHFKNRSYKDTFVPVFKDDMFFLSKKTNQTKDNQLFVYQYLKTNQAILEFEKNTVFYFNSKSVNEFTDYMNIIVSHCEMNI